MDSTCRDFWKMVIDRKCGVIIMLSGLKENEKVSVSISTTDVVGEMVDTVTTYLLCPLLVTTCILTLLLSSPSLCVSSLVQEVCTQYWPSESQGEEGGAGDERSVTCGEFTVETSKVQHGNFTRRTFSVVYSQVYTTLGL